MQRRSLEADALAKEIGLEASSASGGLGSDRCGLPVSVRTIMQFCLRVSVRTKIAAGGVD